MPFRFSIRDDDTCYFTKPEDLEANYGRVWDRCPISLSVVPFHACTKTGALPPEYWQGKQVFPIGDNTYLVKFLREKIREGRVYITMHGYSHKDERDGYEFETGHDLERKVAEGKRYLEQVFGVPVRVFVPPHNSLSRPGFLAVVNNGLSICGCVGLRSRPLDLAALWHSLVRRAWSLMVGGEYPFPQGYVTHTELGYHSLTPLVPLNALRAALASCRRWKGWFCLATHYWEFEARQETGEDRTMGDVFREFWNEVSGLSDARFVSLATIA